MKRTLVLLAAAIANGTVVWTGVVLRHSPADPEAYLHTDPRAHTLLADVPLHDVWVAHLRGGGGEVSMEDVRRLLMDGFQGQHSPAMIGTVAVRSLLGTMFGWDADGCEGISDSYVSRLSIQDRERSLHEPGEGSWIYTFEREALAEIINCTVHAFVALTLQPVEDGYDFYWAFYVKPVSWVTPYYMGLITPFRRTLIYPSIIDAVEREWSARVIPADDQS